MSVRRVAQFKEDSPTLSARRQRTRHAFEARPFAARTAQAESPSTKTSETLDLLGDYVRIRRVTAATEPSVGAVQRSWGLVQRKWDHLFNDIPKTLANVPKAFRRDAVEEVRHKLITLRDKLENGQDDVHEGEDKNARNFGLISSSFLLAVELYGRGDLDERGLREATLELWKNSVDFDVATALGGREKDIKAWKALEKETWEVLARHF